MERKLFKKKDILILIILLSLSLFFFVFMSREKGETAEIWIGGKLYRTFDLDVPFELMLDNGVGLIGDGDSVRFEHSDCDDKICINTGKLSVSGEWAACLPNETVVKIRSGNERVDTVS